MLADSAEYATALEIESALQDYPVLDESHFSDLEHDEAMESWRNWGASDFRKALFAEWDGDDTQDPDGLLDALDDVSDDALWTIYRDNDGWYESDDGGTYFTDIDGMCVPVDEVVPEYVKMIKRERLEAAPDKFADCVRWWWDDQVAFVL